MSGRYESPRRPRGLWRTVIAVLLLLVGSVLLLWGDLSSMVSQVTFDQERARVLEASGLAARTSTDAPGESAEQAAAAYGVSWDALVEYNRKVAAGELPVNDPFAETAEAADLSGLSSVDYLIGSVSIPSMDCELPVYFGASAQNLSRGAAVISGTSVPLGTADSNCAIAAHRSSRAADFFRNVESVSEGDLLTLATPWGTYEYRAVGCAVVDPRDAKAVCVVPGKDLVTIVTCHPYGYSTQRYVVYFERSEEGRAVSDEEFSFVRPQEGSPELALDDAARRLGLVLALAALGLIVFRLVKAIFS